MSPLPTYVDGWRESIASTLALVDDLTPEQWASPTDCPGWTVQDVVAHLAHLESELVATEPAEGPAGATEVVSAFTEIGVVERRGRPAQENVAELRSATTRRIDQLTDLPDDPSTSAPVTPGGVAWSWDVLLRNRCVDAWVHEQDVRRALDVPGGFDGTAAQVVVMTFASALPYVLGKRVRPEPGTTVRWDVQGPVPLDLVVRIGDDGRASRVDTVDGPVTELHLSTESFTVLAAGRRTADDVTVGIDGDARLGRAVLDHMAVTP